MRPVILLNDTSLKVRSVLYPLIFLLLSASAFAQPCFKVVDPVSGIEGEYEGCMNFFVKVQKCPGVTTPTYRFDLPPALVQTPGGLIPDYVPPNQIPSDTLINSFFSPDTHTYKATGVYVIAQYVDFLTPIYLKKIRVFDPSIKPAFTWEVCGKKVKINFTDSVFSRYAFTPGDGLPEQIIDGKEFEYSYNFSQSSATFTFSVKGLKPSTCNKELVPATVTLYQNASAPVPILLEGLGTDTLLYRVQIGVRADEAYGFQQAIGTADFSGLTGPGRQDENVPVLDINLPPLDGNGLWNSRLRSVTKKCYQGSDQIEPALQYWTVFWPRCQSENQKITINWPSLSIPGLVKFQLIRDNSVLAQPDPAAARYIDSAGLVCGSTYSYRFRTEVTLPGGGVMVFISPEVIASAISNRPPDPVRNVSATVLPAGIRIFANPSPIATLYHLFRRDRNSGTFIETGTGFTSIPITDATAKTNENAYCYRISFDDVCGNRSLLSDSICPVLLKVSKEPGGSLSFGWTSLDGWKNGLDRYELLVRKASGPEELTLYSGKDLRYEQQGQLKDSKKLIFRLLAVPESPALYPDSSFSNEVELIQDSRFRFPDSFTPNNDRINDVFQCYGSFISTYQLIIYNAWGNVVFSTDKPNEGWDGKIDGQPAQTGNYAYRAIATDEAGERMEKSGFFSLVR